MPVLSFDSLDAVPSEFRESAVQGEDGKMKVDLVLRKKLDEFRDNNVKYQKERDEAVTQVGPLREIIGDDPDAFRAQLDELRNMKQRVDAGELKESRQVEEAVNKRTEDMRRDHNDSLQKQSKETAAWKTRHDELDRRFKQSTVVAAIKDAALDTELGVDPRAIRDITSRALGVFRADDAGKITAYEGGGSDTVAYGSTGDPLTAKEWIQRLREEAPYFFKNSQGGGSAGGAGGDKKIAGTRYTREDLAKMSPKDRLAAINGEQGARL